MEKYVKVWIKSEIEEEEYHEIHDDIVEAKRNGEIE
jgi:hypothetical protein